MNKHVSKIINKLHEAKQEVAKYTKALATLQDVCEHKWHYKGHWHNDSLYRCSECNAEEWR